jgi:hypothetical protein
VFVSAGEGDTLAKYNYIPHISTVFADSLTNDTIRVHIKAQKFSAK